ncbi:MAG: transposase [Geminicoccaceae bacterium]
MFARHLAAWLGLVPRQRSSGGLLGRSKRGDGYCRRQLMYGARAAVRISPGREGKLWSGSMACCPGVRTTWPWPQSLRLSQGQEAGRIIGGRPADLIEAAGR